jgi:phosphoglycerate dehydrogenase-like enzyme
MKPRCLLVLDDQFADLLLGRDDVARLAALTDLALPRIDPAALRDRADLLRDAELIVSSWHMPVLDQDILERAPRLRALFHCAGTIKHLVTEASWARGIRVTSAALENAKPTAEFAFAEIILSLKRAWPRIFALREQRHYAQHDPLAAGCYQRTVGLLSLGKIGRLVAQRLASLEVRVIAYDPFITPAAAEELGVQLCPLAEVFATADVVSCHMPLTDQTAQALGRELFARLKPGATFINTARGGLVDEAALVDVLRSRPDLCAVLDVTETEPPAPDSPLFRLPNVVLTPHIAGSGGLECRRLGRMMVEEVERYLGGQPLLGEVFREQLSTLA